MAQIGNFQVPKYSNEPIRHYAPNSEERRELDETLKETIDLIKESDFSFEVPCLVDGKEVRTGSINAQFMPFNHQKALCIFHQADPETVSEAIKTALIAKPLWEAMPFHSRAAIFLKAADLLSTTYRYRLMSATMLGQGKNIWQAEIDAAAELIDFWRFNCMYAAEIYNNQPCENSMRTWNRMEYRPLEGFVLAVSPFNFTAIGGHLPCAPALMGNVVLWKPSPYSIYSNYIILQILYEAGLPAGVIQFVPGDAIAIIEQAISNPDFAGIHYTGSTAVFKNLWQKISFKINIYKSFPRLVGETGGKNMHFIHESAEASSAAMQTVRSAFEYSGQKCSACSRAYVPDSTWPTFSKVLLEEIAKIKVGSVDDFTNFMGPVIGRAAFDRIKKYIEVISEDSASTIIAGGTWDDSKGFFIQPTVILTSNPKSFGMMEEIFGPVLTIYVYPADQYEQTLELADKTSQYGLSAALFAQNRNAIILGTKKLTHSAGNFYINDKCTGAVVGQQPFGGSRLSGTNDKAGSVANLLRWVSPRAIKENFLLLTEVTYPSNDI